MVNLILHFLINDKGLFWGFDVDLTATRLLYAAVSIKVPGLYAIGTEVKVFFLVAVIGV